MARLGSREIGPGPTNLIFRVVDETCAVLVTLGRLLGLKAFIRRPNSGDGPFGASLCESSGSESRDTMRRTTGEKCVGVIAFKLGLVWVPAESR